MSRRTSFTVPDGGSLCLLSFRDGDLESDIYFRSAGELSDFIDKGFLALKKMRVTGGVGKPIGEPLHDAPASAVEDAAADEAEQG